MACFRRLTCLKLKFVADRGTVNFSRSFSEISSQNLRVTQTEKNFVAEEEDAHYPLIKPQYPPGIWGNIVNYSAWNIHKWTHQQLSIPKVKERLESMAGQEKRNMWLMEAMDWRPNTLEFKQHITKTHIIKGLPTEIYNSVDVENAYSKIRNLIPDILLQEHEYLHKQKLEKNLDGIVDCDETRYLTHRLLGSFARIIQTSLLPYSEHLLLSQLDESVRVETFWHFGGFTGEERKAKGKRAGFTAKDGTCLGVLQFQYKHIADWQIRTEMPLPEFISPDSLLCREGHVPRTDYVPITAGYDLHLDRPTNISGHWIGDPCEYGLLSLNTMPSDSVKNLEKLGKQYLDIGEISYGLGVGFGSCASQAYNQGFSDLIELTYPFTTQCVVSNGRDLRFFAYQLNTLQLWNEARTLRNILWASEPVRMFDAIENGQVKGLNEDAFKMLTKMFMLKPVDRGIALRPYLPEEESPLKKSLYINKKGEEPFPVTKIGRFQYPANTVYF